MRKLLAVCISALVAVLSAAASAQTAPSDQAQLQAVYTKFARDFRHKDVDGIMSLYVHDTSLFVFDVAPPREHIGWDDYRNDWKGLFALFKGSPSFDISELMINSSGDIAYSHSIQHARGTMTNGRKLDIVVRVTDVLRKAAGRWLIVQEHVSVPVNLLTGKADLQSRP
jgi:ketosteroid isomerase-like protein